MRQFEITPDDGDDDYKNIGEKTGEKDDFNADYLLNDDFDADRLIGGSEAEQRDDRRAGGTPPRERADGRGQRPAPYGRPDGRRSAEPERRDSRKKPRKQKRKNSALKTIIWILAILIVAVALAAGVIYAAVDVLGLTKDGQGKSVYIKEGATVKEIAAELKEKDVINSELLFRLYSKLKKNPSYKFGTYNFGSAIGYNEIIDKLITDGSKAPVVKFRVREGTTVDMITKQIEWAGICSKSDFKSAMSSAAYGYNFEVQIPVDKVYRKWEGYLFPAIYDLESIEGWGDSTKSGTIGYRIAAEQTANNEKNTIAKAEGKETTDFAPSSELQKDIDAFFTESKKLSEKNAKSSMQKMVAACKNAMPADIEEKAKAMGRSVHEIMTLASIIEAEVGGHDESELNLKKDKNIANTVAAIFYNRLAWTDQPKLLGSDPTNAYAKLTGNQNYNTYVTKGLPPGPIGAPRKRYIEAALNPTADCPYYYFLTDSDFVFYCSKTLTEHTRIKNDLIAKKKWA